MDIINDIATVVGLVRDVVLLLLLTVALIALLAVFGKTMELLKTIKQTVDTIQDTVSTISEKVIEPAASTRRTGRFFGFLLGMRDSKRRKSDD